MPIDIECEECGNTYRVADEKAGGKVRCKECGAKIDVPDPDRDELFESDGPRRSGGGRRRKGSSEGLPTGVIVGGIVAVCVIGVLVFALSGRGGGPAPGPQVAQDNPALPAPPPFGGGNSLPRPPANVAPTPAPASTLPVSALPSSGTAANPPASNQPVAALPGSKPPGTTSFDKGTADSRPATLPKKGGTGKGFAGFAAGNGGNNGIAATGVDGPAPENWNVKVDPSKTEIKIDPAKPINIKFPKDASHDDVIYPVTPSVYVALGSNSFGSPVREIWNLATRNKTGTITNKIIRGRSVEALSPDGQYIAANIDKFFEKKSGVRVWTAKGNKGLGELTTTAEVKAVLFPSPQRLIALCAGGMAYVWKLPSGDLEHELNLNKAELANAVAVSPGGNYLAAVVDDSNLKIFDLNTGEVAGEQSLPVKNGFAHNKPDAVSFSPDGLELAMVIPSGTWDQALAIYNVADGKLISTAELNTKNVSHSTERVAGNRLEWFPDRSKLLWRGHYVLDAKIGGPVWSAPDEDGSSDAPRKLLDSTKIVVVTGGRNSPSLITAPVPVDEIDAAAEAVANGGDAVEAGMPALGKADYSKVVPVAATATAAWSMKPDPAPAGPVVKSSIGVPPQRPTICGVFLSRPDVGRAVLWYTNNGQAHSPARGFMRMRNIDPPAGRDTVIIDVVDLTTGKLKGPIAIRYPSLVLDVSPDGDYAAIKSTKRNDDRLDIYDIREDKQVAGWRPYQDKENSGKEVTKAILIDQEYCLTVNRQNIVYMWKLPECQAVWRMEGGSNWCLSPGAKYLGFQSGGRYAFLDPKTGEIVGDVQANMGELFCAFHPIGTHFALLGFDGLNHKLFVVDVATGKTTADFYVPFGNASLQWCGDEHILVDGNYLINLPQQKAAWTYLLPYGFAASNQPGDKAWYVTSGGALDQNAFLSNATLPDKPALAQIEAGPLPDDALLQPGMKINLQVSLVAASPVHPNLAAEVATSYRAAMEKAGFVLGTGTDSPYTFVISTAMNNPGRNMELEMDPRNGVGPRTKISLPITQVNGEVNLMLNGQSIWKHSLIASNRLFGFALIKAGEDPATHLTNQMWNSLAIQLKNQPVPRQIFKSNAGTTLGKSNLVPGGTQQVPN